MLERKWAINELAGVSTGMALLAFPSIRGFALCAARDSLPRRGNPLWPSRMNDSALWPRWIINEIAGVSTGIRLLAFPSARGSLSSLPNIPSPARGIRSGRVG